MSMTHAFPGYEITWGYCHRIDRIEEGQPFIMALLWVLRQRVHTYSLSVLPSRMMVDRCTFANHLVRVRLFEWLTLLPD